MTMDTQLRDNPLWLIWLLSSHLKPYAADFAERHDLTPSQLNALLSLDPHTAVPMSRLSCLVGCDPSYTTGVVDKLVSADLLVRQESTEDRRVKSLALTPRGVKLRKELMAGFLKEYESLDIAEYVSPAFLQKLTAFTSVVLESSRKRTTATRDTEAKR